MKLTFSKPADELHKVLGSSDESLWLLLINEVDNATFCNCQLPHACPRRVTLILSFDDPGASGEPHTTWPWQYPRSNV